MTAVTLEDINKYITMIRINFENAYKTQGENERKMLYLSWLEILKEYPKEICDRAVLQAIKKAKFPPRIGDIVEEVEKMKEAFEKSDNELWQELSATFPKVRNYHYRYRFNAPAWQGSLVTQGDIAREENKRLFESLDPLLKTYLRNLGQLIELAELPDEQINYEKARFFRIMPDIRRRQKTLATLPNNLTQLLQGVSVTVGCVETKLLKE